MLFHGIKNNKIDGNCIMLLENKKMLSTFAKNNYVYGKSIRYFERNICSL